MFSFLGKQRARNIAVVDVSCGSVGAAYASLSGVAPPAIIYSARLAVGTTGADDAAVLRTLDRVARDMHDKGAPLLHKATGTGAVSAVTLLIGNPWQTSSLSVKVFEEEKPFVFTKAMLVEAAPSGARSSITSTVLNGYETADPIGKRAKRAEISVLSSLVHPEVKRLGERALRSFVGAAPISITSFAEAAPAVLKDFFPHERDFLVLRAGCDATEIAFVKQGHLAGVETALAGSASFTHVAKKQGVSSGALVDGIVDRTLTPTLEKHSKDAEEAWILSMRDAFLKVAAEGALPRTLFLFSEDRILPLWKRLLDAPELHTLWLSDEPLSVIPMTKNSLAASMRRVNTLVEDDVVLSLLCLLSRIR